MTEPEAHPGPVDFPEKDRPLRADVNILGELLGDVLREQGGPELFERVERARRLARAHRAGDASAREALVDSLSGLDPDAAEAVTRAFAAYFSLVNLAEHVHRIRRARDYASGGTRQPGSLEASLSAAREAGLGPDDLAKLVSGIAITPVFTAHPTEATRRTLLAKEQRVARLLVRRIVGEMLPDEEARVLEKLRGEVTRAWQTEEHRSDRPTVADEVEHVVFTLTEVLYDVVPELYRTLERAIDEVVPERAPASVPSGFLRFGTWVGGDMDGNPAVGAATVRATLERQRELVLDRYVREVRELFGHLSQSVSRVAVSEAVLERVGEYRALLPEVDAAIPRRYHDMPYRVLLWLVSARLDATRRDAPGRYDGPTELADDLRRIQDSLLENRGAHGGADLVRALVRRVETFGFHLACLDLREDALVHRRAAGAMLGRTNFEELEPARRAELLSDALARGHDPGRPPEAAADSDLGKVLEVLAAVREGRRRFGSDAIGPYIISMAQGVDDALALLWLGQRGGLGGADGSVPLDIAPLFETVDDLDRAARVMDELFRHPRYRRHLELRGDRQLVMLGYSDSNRESGLVASRWALQEAQEALLRTSEKHGVRLTLFHGRGGSISRGGSKPRSAILAEPPGAVRGRLRVTEQGEIIHSKFGIRELALRTFELMGGAVIEATAVPSRPAPDSWREVVGLAAGEGRATYRSLVFDEPDFFAYFREATPIDVIERLRIGSRPAARRSKAGIENLRAIPWVFAWTQSRHMLPGWFGVGTGLTAAEERFGLDALREMALGWPFFANMLSDVEMVLAKADLGIARRYAELAGPLGERFFPRIEREFDATRGSIARITGRGRLLEDDPVLDRAIRLRNPYVDPMSVLQVDLLRRWRDGDRKDEELARALLSTVKGIARGLRNTG